MIKSKEKSLKLNSSGGESQCGITHAIFSSEFTETLYTEFLILSLLFGIWLESIAAGTGLLASLIFSLSSQKLTLITVIIISIGWLVASMLIAHEFFQALISAYIIIIFSSCVFILSLILHFDKLEWKSPTDYEKKELKHKKNMKDIDKKMQNDSFLTDISDDSLYNSSDSLFNLFLDDIEDTISDENGLTSKKDTLDNIFENHIKKFDQESEISQDESSLQDFFNKKSFFNIDEKD